MEIDRSTSLESCVEEVFSEHGLLSQHDPHFRPRAGQTKMALAVARCIEDGSTLVVEAGTGVGKTYAYLVPALQSGERVVLSTATKALQDQLFGRDLPRLVQTLGLPVRMALLKGRSSYLCLHRLEIARQDVDSSERGLYATLAKVEQWSKVTRNGDLAELIGLDERSPAIPLITSNRENCLATQCPQFRSCHVNLARREAMAADVVVINHHLFFADLSVRDSGMAELLPTTRVVIFDEAHQLNEIGVQFLGTQLTTGQILDLARDSMAAGLQFARGLNDWSALASGLERASRELRLSAGKHWMGTKLRWTELQPEGLNERCWVSALESVGQVCQELLEALKKVSELAPDFVRLYERVLILNERVLRFGQACPGESVRWLEVGTQLRLVESPLDIAESVQNKMLKLGNPEFENKKSWIFTSATMGHDDRLTWFTEPCGLGHAALLRVDSPFDYKNQASIYIPKSLPKPNDPAHSSKVADMVAEAVDVLNGRTLVLTTTLRALRAIGEQLQQKFQNRLDIEVLIQGNQPKRELLARFREGASQGRAACVLVASASFWEGIDVPGDALALVIIDKLPFPPPNDPLVEARSKRLETQGRSPFNDYFIPEASVSLKQGAGRLIRRESDVGLLVICDTRLIQMGYGRRILAALPPMHRLENQDDFAEALKRLTKVSTSS